MKFDGLTFPYFLRDERRKEQIYADKKIVGEAKELSRYAGGRGQIISGSADDRYPGEARPTNVSLIWTKFQTGGVKMLDLEDGSNTISVIFSSLTLRRDVALPKIVSYSAIFEEVDNPT